MRSLKKLVIVVLFLFMSKQDYVAQIFDWVKGISGEGVFGLAIATDKDGNSYLTGYFFGTAEFGTNILTSSGSSDIFIAKYDNWGNCVWAQKAGDVGIVNGDIGTGVSVDTLGNCYITGHFEGTAIFGTITLGGSGRDIFIAKYDNAGNCLWAKKAGGDSEDRGNGIYVDPKGNSYVTGSFSGTANFGTTTLTSAGYSDIFIAKYDNAGNCLWAKKAGGTSGDSGSGISTDHWGNSYVTGSFSGTANFGTTTLTSAGYSDIFIAKYDNAGNCLWAQKAGGTSMDGGSGIAVDTCGNSYVIGYIRGTATFGSTIITNEGGFVAKYDEAGNCLWAKKVGGTDYVFCNGISVDAVGNGYVIGSFEGTITFGATTLTSLGGDDAYIVKYDNAGNCLWAQKAGGYSDDYGNGISVLSEGVVNVTGNIKGYANFGNINLSRQGGFNARIITSLLNINSPHGGEVWQINTQHNITWSSIDDGDIKIEITTNNGINWITLQNNIAAYLGNYTLTVPPFLTSSECKIKLTSLLYGNVSISNSFTITSTLVPDITVTSPNTILKWKCGSSQNITWNISGSIDNVKIEYTTDNGGTWSMIANNIPATDLTYTWIVPNTFSTKCRIRVSDTTNSALNDVSDFPFTIYDIQVTSPDIWDKWRATTKKNITWFTACINNINLYYSINGGIDWHIIASNISAGKGSYLWDVPNIASTDCKIKIVDVTDITLFSISNTFTIWKPIVSIKTPPIGQNTQNFDLTNIDFISYIIISDAITVTYYFNEVPIDGGMPEGVVGVGKYYWHISSPNISFINGIIRVPLATLSGVIDATKLVWLKRTNSGDNWVNIGGEIQGEYMVSTIVFDSFSEFTIGTTSDENPLPVELNSFSANVTSEMEVTLLWNTETEVNNSGFTIQKKILNTKQWQDIGFVPGNGTTTKPIAYAFKDLVNFNGIYLYRLKQIDFSGKFTFSNEISVEVTSLLNDFTLEQNYPNPFNPSTIICFALPNKEFVKLSIFNIIGEEVATLINNELEAGWYRHEFNASSLSSGIYFYKLQAGKFSETKKMILVR